MKTWVKVLAASAGVLIAVKAIQAVAPLAGTNSNLPASVQPGGAQGKTSSSNFRLRSSLGEVQSSTLTSSGYDQFAGGQHLLSWPGTLTSLSALGGVGPNQVKLSWIAPGADGTVGAAGAYLIKYRLSGPFATESDFDSGFLTYVSSIPPQGPGALEQRLITDISANTTYYFAVVAVDSFNVHSYLSNPASAWTFGPPDTTPPANISDLTALVGDIDGRIHLNWTSPGDNQMSGSLIAARYRIHASTAAFGYFSSTASATEFGTSDFDTAFTTNGVAPGTRVGVDVDGLNPGTTYYLAAIARDNANNWSFFQVGGPLNRLSSAPAQDLPLGAPTSAAASVFTSSLTLSWTAPAAPANVDDRAQYRLYAATAAFSSVQDAWVRLSSTVDHPLASATTAQLLPNSTYFLAVTAVDSGTVTPGFYSAALESAPLFFSTVTLAAVPIPSAFSGTDVHLTSLTFNWLSNADPAGTVYRVQISTDSGFAVFSTSDTANLSLSSATLSVNATYFFRVGALNFGGLFSGYSAVLGTSTLPAPAGLTTPNWAAADVGANAATARWTIGSNPAGTLFHVEFATSAAFAGVVTSSDTYVLAASTSGLLGSTTLAFRVEAVNGSGVASSFTVSAATSTLADSPLSGSPTSFFNVLYTSAALQWNANGNGTLTPYFIEISTAADFTGGADASTGWGAFVFATHTFTGLSADTTYYAQIKARNFQGLETGFTFLGSTVTQDNIPPAAITSLSALTGGSPGTVTLSWIAPGDDGTTGQAVTYEVREAVPPFDWAANYNSAVLVTNSLPADPAGTLETYTAPNLTPGATYAFNVKAVDKAGNFAGIANGATTYAGVTNNTTAFFLTTGTVSAPASARALVYTAGGASDVTTRVTPNTGATGVYFPMQPLATVTGAGLASLPTPTTTYGWIYDASLRGKTVEAGNWTLNGRYQMSNASLQGSLFYRLERVTVTSSSTSVQSFLTQGTDGWVQWGGGNLAATTVLTATTALASVSQTYFGANDRLMVEFAFQPSAGANGARNFRWEIGTSNDFLRSTNIDDINPPNVITTLTASNAGLNEGEVQLQWLTPGDDGTNGQASYYDIRYTNDSNFNWSTNFQGAAIWKSSRTTVGPEGSQETELVTNTGLAGGVTYYFRIKAFDAANPPNASLSLPATQWAQVDVASPSAISDLTALPGARDGEITLSWTAPGDDGTRNNLVSGSAYLIRASTASFAYFSSTVANFAPGDRSLNLATSSVVPGSAQGTLITGLYPGTTWFFGIVTQDERGNVSTWNKTGSFNLAASTPALDLAPPLPSNVSALAADVSSFSVTLRWSTPTLNGFNDLDRYRVYAATYDFANAGDAAVVLSSDVAHPLTQATTAQLFSNTTYYFKVTSMDQGDQHNGFYSGALESFPLQNYSTVTLPALPSPQPFTGTDVHRSSLTLHWLAGQNSPGTRYRVLVSTDAGFGIFTASDSAALALTSATLSPNASYFFRVGAFNYGGLFSGYSATLATATLANPPLTAASTFTFVGPTDVTAQWLANGNPSDTAYLFYVSTAAGFIAADVTTDTVFAVNDTTSSLAQNASYFFRVSALNRQGLETVYADLGSTQTLVLVDFTPPNNLSDLTALAGAADGQVVLQWTSPGNDGTTGTLNNGQYRIRYSTTAFSYFSSTAPDLSAPAATLGIGDLFVSTTGVPPGRSVGAAVNGLNPGTTYFFAVIAKDNSGNWSFFTSAGFNAASSAPARDLPLAAPAALNAAAVSNNALTLSWTNPAAPANIDDRAQYRLYAATAAFTTGTESWVTISSVVSHPLSQAATAQLQPNASGFFRVSALDQGDQGSGLYSAALESPLSILLGTATLANPPLEGAPTSFFNVAYTSAALQWSANANPAFTEYQIQISTGRGFNGANDQTAGWGLFLLSTHTFTGLLSDVTYYAQIRARNSQHLETAYAFLGSTKTLDNIPPAAVTDLAALTGPSEGIVNLSWSAPGNDGNVGVLDFGSRFHIATTTVLGNAQSDVYWNSRRDLAEIQIATANVQPGDGQAIAATGLTGGVTYYFRIWTRDNAGNWSGGLSVGATAWAQQDLAAPGAITNLAAARADPATMAINLSWSMPGDDGYAGTIAGGTVTVRYRTDAQGGAILTDADFNAANSTVSFSTTAAQGTPVLFPVTGLANDTTYYFAVKITDERGNLSAISNSTFTVSPDTVAPAAVTSLTALPGADGGEVNLSWIAPGDNGTVGQAAYYEIREAVPPFDWAANYNSAVLITNALAADPSGTLESFTVQNLTPGTTYSFRVKAVDEASNFSGLSNSATTYAALVNNTTNFYLRTSAVSAPSSARALTTSAGSVSNPNTKVSGTTNGNFYVLQPLVNVAGTGVASLPAATTTFGWIYDASLAGLTVVQGSWTLSGRYSMSNATLAGALFYRIERVTVTATSSTLKSFLTQGTNGWVQWGGSNLPSTTILTATATVASVTQTDFQSGDRLMIEFAFQATAGAQAGRSFNWESDTSQDFLKTTNIQDIYPPNQITALTALNSDGSGNLLQAGQIQLQWEAPGDDGTTGQASYYDIRYTNDPSFNWDNNFQGATIWKSSRPTGGAEGFAETELVSNTGLVGGVTYYFRIQAFDDATPVNSSLSLGATAVAPGLELGVLVVGATNYDFALQDMGVSSVAASGFALKNVGNVREDFNLSATTVTPNSPWSLATSSATDKMILWGGFSPTRPNLSDYGSEDVILYNSQTPTATKFAINASSGTGVPEGDLRNLWLRVDTPLITSTTEQQNIRVFINSSQSP